MKDVGLPDLAKVRGAGDKRELPPQASAEDTSNWDDRAITLPNPHRYAVPITTDIPQGPIDGSMLVNPYVEQERLKSVRSKK